MSWLESPNKTPLYYLPGQPDPGGGPRRSRERAVQHNELRVAAEGRAQPHGHAARRLLLRGRRHRAQRDGCLRDKVIQSIMDWMMID